MDFWRETQNRILYLKKKRDKKIRKRGKKTLDADSVSFQE